MKYHDIIGRMMHFFALHRIAIFKAGEGTGIKRGQLPLLNMIDEHKSSTQKELADFLFVSPASIAVSIKRMQKQGLVTKAADSDDLRYNRITLTPEGQRILNETRASFDAIDERVFSGFTDEECETFYNFIDRMANNISDISENACGDFHAILAEEHKIFEKERTEAEIND